MRRGVTIAVVLLLIACPVVGTAKVGLGIVAGEPTGLSLKVWSNSRQAFDLAAGWSLGDGDWVYLHGDFLLHSYALEDEIEEDFEGRLPFYYGIGARVLLSEDHDSRFGVRIPLGLDYIFSDGRFDIFLEVAPVLDLVPETDLDLAGGIGVRYYF